MLVANTLLARLQQWKRSDVARPGWEKDQVREAYEEWKAMEQYFHQVTEPRLVDRAIYLLKAAEERYRHCLEQARKPSA